MGALTKPCRGKARVAGATLAALLLWTQPARADPVDRWAPQVREAAARFGLPVAWVRGVILAESGGATELGGVPITSRAGAMGLMQLMPETWREMRQVLRLGPDPHDPRDNILAGSLYLRQMYDRFGYPGLFAAYNAGPGRYADHLAGRRALPAETLAYVAQLARPAPVTASPLRILGARAAAPGPGPHSAPIFEQRGGQAIFITLTTARR